MSTDEFPPLITVISTETFDEIEAKELIFLNLGLVVDPLIQEVQDSINKYLTLSHPHIKKIIRSEKVCWMTTNVDKQGTSIVKDIDNNIGLPIVQRLDTGIYDSEHNRYIVVEVGGLKDSWKFHLLREAKGADTSNATHITYGPSDE